MPVSIIYDGFSVDGVLSNCDEHDEVNFTYRPATEAVYGRYSRKCEELGRKPAPPAGKPDPISIVTATFLAEHTQSWDIVGKEGEVVEPTAENCAKLPTIITVKLLETICTSVKSGVIREQLGN